MEAGRERRGQSPCPVARLHGAVGGMHRWAPVVRAWVQRGARWAPPFHGDRLLARPATGQACGMWFALPHVTLST